MPTLCDIHFRLALANGCTDLAGNLFDGHHPEESFAFCHCSIDKALPMPDVAPMMMIFIELFLFVLLGQSVLPFVLNWPYVV